MPNYQNGKIYKLWTYESDDIYIGSTTQLLCQRLSGHKLKKDCTSSVLFEKSNNVMIELIEEYPCENKEKLNKREGELIRELNCVNKIIPGRTKREYNKQYYQDNLEKIQKYKKQYIKDNHDKILENKKEKITCECNCEITRSHLAQHKRTNKHIKLMKKLNYLP